MLQCLIYSSGTDPNGGLYTQTIVSTSLSTPSGVGDGSSTRSSSSHIGAIVGGAVGGVVALAVVSVLLWWCVRKRKREEFDGNFDPDRVVATSPGGDGTLPRLDLEVTPYSYDPESGGDYLHNQAPPGMPVPQHAGYDMSQRHDAPMGYAGAAAAASSHYSQHSDPYGNHSSTTGSHYPPTSPHQSVTGMPVSNDFRNVSPGPSLGTTGTIPSAKEREIATDRRRLYLASDEEELSSGSNVLQHQDGGRIPLARTPEEPRQEIPPSYDSIGPDEEGARR